MFELNANNAAAYLRDRGFDATSGTIRELGGGVSNTVLLVEGPTGRLVLKQSLGKLRVEQDWFSDRKRIFRESGIMRDLRPHLAPAILPEVFFEDRASCLFAMSAAPAAARPWKSNLLEGDVDAGIAASIGATLASMVRISWMHQGWERVYGDQAVFDQLRLDPYYRSTARRHPDLAPAFSRLMQESSARRVSLVHGDWSPKNFLVCGDSIMAIDFEVIHFGDPAFDAAFLLNHLLLKSFYRATLAPALGHAAECFWREFQAGLPADCNWMEGATMAHLGCLLLARIDGKSPAEYLTDPETREQVRGFARRLIQHPPATVKEVFTQICG